MNDEPFQTPADRIAITIATDDETGEGLLLLGIAGHYVPLTLAEAKYFGAEVAACTAQIVTGLVDTGDDC